MKDRPMPKAGTKSTKEPPVSLEKRARYAIDCIEADMPSKEKARLFLTKVKEKLDNPDLVSQIDKVLQDGT